MPSQKTPAGETDSNTDEQRNSRDLSPASLNRNHTEQVVRF